MLFFAVQFKAEKSKVIQQKKQLNQENQLNLT